MSGTSFGERLREARQAKGLILSELGDRVDSSKAYMWQLENKEEARPSPPMLLGLCNALDVTPGWLLNDDTLDDIVLRLAQIVRRARKETP